MALRRHAAVCKFKAAFVDVVLAPVAVGLLPAPAVAQLTAGITAFLVPRMPCRA